MAIARLIRGADGMDTRHAPDAHAGALYKGRQLDVTVTRAPAGAGSHIVVVVHDDTPDAFARRAEYVVGDLDADAALGAGIALARALVDGTLH